MEERRDQRRYTIWFPVTLTTGSGGVWAICRDASTRGILISSATALAEGTPVKVTFRVAYGEGEERTVEGRVVRLEKGQGQSTRWPHNLGIAFDEPIPELDGQLEHHSTRPPPPAPDQQ